MIVALLVAWPAGAQQACAPRDQFVETLAQKYQESQTAWGVGSTGTILELFASPSGSWTAAVSYPNGTTCMVASGQSWTPVAPKDEGSDS